MKKFFIILYIIIFITLAGFLIWYLDTKNRPAKSVSITNINNLSVIKKGTGPYWETPSNVDQGWRSIVIEPVFEADVLVHKKPPKVSSTQEEQVYDTPTPSEPEVVQIF